MTSAASVYPLPTVVAATWVPVDLEPVLAGELVEPEPCLLARSDGRHLLYPGKIHWFFGESEGGKTWLLNVASAEAIADGKRVTYLDFEDSSSGVVGRLLALGCTSEAIRQNFVYVRPADPPESDSPVAQLARGTALAVIDGVTEAMGLLGLDPLGNRDIPTFKRRLLMPFRDAGASVVAIDHVTKNAEGRGRYPIGAQHKLAGLDGAAYLVEAVRPFGRGLTGMSRITIAKDRPGRVRQHAPGGHVANLQLRSEADGSVLAALLPPASNDDGSFRPTLLMERVSQLLEASTESLSGRQIESGVRGKAGAIRAAVSILIDEQHIAAETGPRHSTLHRSISPYRQENDE